MANGVNWWEKEEAFEKAYRSGRCAENLWAYIPKKKYDAVRVAYVDTDGYWAYLEQGYTAYDGGEDCGVIHDYNITDFKESIKTVRKRGE